MKKTFINKSNISGRVFSLDKLAVNVGKPGAKNEGVVFISGTINVATDDACLNIVPVRFNYVTKTTKSGAVNKTFATLEQIINSGKTVESVGKDAALKVEISNAKIQRTDYYSDKTGEVKLTSFSVTEDGFISIVSNLKSEESRNAFEVDTLLTKAVMIEANPDRGIAKDYLLLSGYVFNDYFKSIYPIEFAVHGNEGITYFESQDINDSNRLFTRVKGYTVNSTVMVAKTPEEGVFGGSSAVDESPRSLREFVVTWAANPYAYGDEETGITADEVTKMLSDREVSLAEKKKNFESRSGSASNATGAFSANAAAGSFNFL